MKVLTLLLLAQETFLTKRWWLTHTAKDGFLKFGKIISAKMKQVFCFRIFPEQDMAWEIMRLQ